ncbi:MAG: glycosyltransferase [Lachnospiraceae bacterium]|nr:glycosyltransferase [Lachnospiraceae bacterium]
MDQETGKKIEVSVFIGAYNQENYIKDALEGALKQKTNFLYEILVHDDASRDHTGEIIKEYEEKYPDKVVGLYEEVNKYDHPEYAAKRMLATARGKYIALCDGDDYWTDENKLQMQYNFMEAHEDFALCTHNTLLVNTKNGKSRLYSKVGATGELPQGYVIENGCSLFHSSSHFLRLKDWVDKHGDLPMFDLYRVIYSADAGRVMYFNRCMSVYRVFTHGSWSENAYSGPVNKISELVSEAEFMRRADKETGYRWHRHFEKNILSIKYTLLGMAAQFYRNFCFKDRFIWLLKWTRDCFGLFPCWLWIRKRVDRFAVLVKKRGPL